MISLNIKNKKAIVLLSGGMDSLLLMAHVQNLGIEIYPIHFSYGQNTQRNEKKSFKDICRFYKIKKENQKLMDIPFLKEIGGSGLTDKKLILSTTGENLAKNIVPNSYVPFRNSLFLAIATAWAETIEAAEIYIGAVEEDSPGYPDCRPAYYNAFNNLIKKGTNSKNPIKVITPLIKLNKIKIIEKLIQLQAPIKLSWSCYKSEKIACGLCDSCRLRLRAFKRANKIDPIPYKK